METYLPDQSKAEAATDSQSTETPSSLYQPPAVPAYQPTYPAYGYQQPYAYYYPQRRPRPNPVIQIGFWVFYALVGFWVDFSLTLTLWACALTLPFTLPLTYLSRSSWLPEGFGLNVNNSGLRLSDGTVYALAGGASVIGIGLLIVAIMSIKPWLKLHKVMFRDLGGVGL